MSIANKPNIALVSPSKNVYSETFIQAHKEKLKGKVFHYYDGELPIKLEGGLVINSRKKRILDIFKGHFRLNDFSLAEQALMTSFKNNNINVVFAEYGPTGQKIMPVCKELNIPLIVHFHGYDASNYEVIKNNGNYQELFIYAKYIVVVSRKMYSDFLKMGCKKEKLIYNASGPREEFFEVKPQFSKNQFIAIGRFTDKKAPYYLILSFKVVVEKIPNAKLIIAGKGELWYTCQNLIKFYGLEENIILPGIITMSEYQAYLTESIAMVQHSITTENGDSEGTPVAILEALAAGVPVISTKHAGIPDIINNGESGFLVDEHDISGFAEKMILLLRNNESCRKMGEQGRSLVTNGFTLDRHINVLDNLIKNTLKI